MGRAILGRATLGKLTKDMIHKHSSMEQTASHTKCRFGRMVGPTVPPIETGRQKCMEYLLRAIQVPDEGLDSGTLRCQKMDVCRARVRLLPHFECRCACMHLNPSQNGSKPSEIDVVVQYQSCDTDGICSGILVNK